ncbi:retrovirus-related pol polyprotein from transposon TNT 1-94 [Tanacetum coccineum]|uniref:Retrovirus-related pol polyprotein from transposon TNT 1-94 n=1 Tax=Tanacetum coccineum TaxID=301880 RepID=A0ABQ5H357_9ASTR
MHFVAQTKTVYISENHPTQNTQYSSTRSQQSTRNRGKAIVTSSAPTYDPEPATVTEDEEMSKEKEIDKLMALISLSINRGTGYDNQRAVNVAGARENVGTPVVQKSGIQCYNCKEYGHVSRECQKPKRVKDAAYHKEKMLLCKQEEAGVQLNAEQADWKDDTDDESEDQELEAHYMYMAQIQEVTPDPVDNSGPIFDDEPMHKVQNNNDNYNVFAMENEHPEQPESSNHIYLAEQGDTNITIDSLDICYNRDQDDQDDTNDLDQERTKDWKQSKNGIRGTVAIQVDWYEVSRSTRGSISLVDPAGDSLEAITPDLPIEEPDNSLSMGDEHLSTIPETESDELIKSSVEILVPIPSLEEVNDDHEEKEFDLEDILQIQDVILRRNCKRDFSNTPNIRLFDWYEVSRSTRGSISLVDPAGVRGYFHGINDAIKVTLFDVINYTLRTSATILLLSRYRDRFSHDPSICSMDFPCFFYFFSFSLWNG